MAVLKRLLTQRMRKIVDDAPEEEHQQRAHKHHLEPVLSVSRERLAPQFLNCEEQHISAIKHGHRQDVEHCQVQAERKQDRYELHRAGSPSVRTKLEDTDDTVGLHTSGSRNDVQNTEYCVADLRLARSQ